MVRLVRPGWWLGLLVGVGSPVAADHTTRIRSYPMPVKNPQEPFTRVTVSEAKKMLDGGDVQFIDVREPGEYAEGHAAGTKLMPLNSVYARESELPNDRDLLFICKSGQRSALACEYAASAGKSRLFNVEGGTDGWREAGLPIEL
jgi:rhodanese-related sulfurtransferase